MCQESRPPNVFLSYSHDSTEHDSQVLALADRLRADGIDAQIDQYETAPAEGWTRWMRAAIKQADFILVICTESYQRRAEGNEESGIGHGVNREGLTIDQDIYETGGRNKRFIAVILRKTDAGSIPYFLRPYQHESAETHDGYERLYRRLTNQPAVIKPLLGKLRPLSPRGKTASVELSIESRNPTGPLGQDARSTPEVSIVRTQNEVVISLRRVEYDNYDIVLEFNHRGQQQIRRARGRIQISLEHLASVGPDLDQYGKTLADQLFGDHGIHRLYSTAREISSSQGESLRMRLSIDPGAPELHSAYWELLSDPDTGRELAISEGILFSRDVASLEWVRPGTIRQLQDLKALIAVSVPNDVTKYGLNAINYGGEHGKRFCEILAHIHVSDAVQPLTVDRLLAGIRQGVDIVCLLANGVVQTRDAQYYLFLQDENGDVAPTEVTALARQISDLPEKPRLIVLAFSDGVPFALNLVRGGVQAVLAMQDKISGETLDYMLSRFLGELLSDSQVDLATARARQSISHRSDHWVPTLFLGSETSYLW